MDVKAECVEWLKASGHQSSFQLHPSSAVQTSERTHFPSIMALPLSGCFPGRTCCLVFLYWAPETPTLKALETRGRLLTAFWMKFKILPEAIRVLNNLAHHGHSFLSSQHSTHQPVLQVPSGPHFPPTPVLSLECEMSSPHLRTPRFPSDLRLVSLFQGDLSRHALLDPIRLNNMLL